MKLYITKTPRLIQQIFKNYTWRFFTDKKEIYLTFDDGPTSEITEFVLSELKKHNAKATFFCIGKNIKNNPKIFEKIISDNHSIGNHTQNHLNGWKKTTEEYLENVLACENNLQGFQNLVGLNYKNEKVKANENTTYKVLKTLQENLKLFRPPYGKIKKSQAKKLRSLGFKIIMWDVLSADFDTSITNQKCLENVLKNTTNGSIIVFHDSKKATEKLKFVLPKVLEYYSKKGFVFKAIA
tara:strand:+ start:1197 stop:1913 length:717 start_codon:yes stop_codon:yes gene_type:complete